MGDRVRLASIGLGRWAQVLASGAQRGDVIELYSCFSRSEERRDDRARYQRRIRRKYLRRFGRKHPPLANGLDGRLEVGFTAADSCSMMRGAPALGQRTFSRTDVVVCQWCVGLIGEELIDLVPRGLAKQEHQNDSQQ